MSGSTNNATIHVSSASFWVPDDMSASDWIEHAPFAFWLVETAAPSLVVELSAGLGFSYLAFCQAIDRLGLAAQARAVGVHATDEARLAAAARNARYAAFSSPVDATPDEARSDFAPGSIDLFHLDGGLDYAEAARIVDAWRPLLSERAVVLLHDTGVEGQRTGSGLLFDELRSLHPAFHFSQGRGLGMVALGGTVPERLKTLLGGAQADSTRAAYAALGAALRLRRRAIADDEALAFLARRSSSGHGTADRGTLPLDCSPYIVRLSAEWPQKAQSVQLADLSRRLAALEAISPRTAPAKPAIQVEAQQDQSRLTSTTDFLVDMERLQAELRDVRASEAEAHRRIRAASRGLRARRADVERQAIDLEHAAEVARAEVTRLAETAWKHLEAEHAADHRRAEAHHRLQELLRHERDMLTSPGGMRGVLSRAAVRRWRRKLRGYASFAGQIEQAATELWEAQEDYAAARDARSRGDQATHAAQPRASELDSASVMLRGELAATEHILSTLPEVSDGEFGSSIDDYGRWVALHDTLGEGDRRAIRARILRLRRRPLISVVMPVYNPKVGFLRQAVASVQSQLYPDWELCIADDASPDPAVRDALREMAEADSRIKLVLRPENGHISAASNSALALASGEFVALMDHDDILPDHALFEVAAALDHNPDLDLIYSDEDHIDGEGRRNTPYFKSDFNPDLLLGHNLINHLGVYRRALLERIGGFRLGFEGSQDYDLALRAVDASAPERVHHIPAVLYHWRSATGADTFSEASLQRCIAAAQRAVADHLERRGHAGEVVAHPTLPNWQRVRRSRPDPAPLVSVIVPTKNKAELVRPCVDGLLHRTAYPDIEVLIVDHQSTEPSALSLFAELARDPRVRILPHEGPFNYSAINNAAVKQARGPVLALLNNDIDVIEPGWLDEMVALAVLPEVGAVGAKLLYPDDRVQHAGVILGAGGVAGHFFHGLEAEGPGYFGRAALASTVAAVTAACLVVRRAVFDEVGGFDAENLPVAFNDVDLCLKIRARGYRNVWTPHACLYHHESVSRGSDLEGERLKRFQREVEFMQHKWGSDLDLDPFYSPNLDITAADFGLAFPPRRQKPWETTALPD